MDFIFFTITKLKQFIDKFKSLFDFIKLNYLSDLEQKEDKQWFIF